MYLTFVASLDEFNVSKQLMNWGILCNSSANSDNLVYSYEKYIIISRFYNCSDKCGWIFLYEYNRFLFIGLLMNINIKFSISWYEAETFANRLWSFLVGDYYRRLCNWWITNYVIFSKLCLITFVIFRLLFQRLFLSYCLKIYIHAQQKKRTCFISKCSIYNIQKYFEM